MKCKDLKVKNGQVFLTNVKGKITIIEELEPHYTKPGNRRIRKFLCDCEIGGIKEIALWKITPSGKRMTEVSRTISTISKLISSIQSSLKRQSNELRSIK